MIPRRIVRALERRGLPGTRDFYLAARASPAAFLFLFTWFSNRALRPLRGSYPLLEVLRTCREKIRRTSAPVPKRVIVEGSGTEANVSRVYPVGRPETVPISVATPVVVLIVKIDGVDGMKVSMP
jgi:hypothetical protein